MSLNRPQRIILVLTLLVVAAMCLIPPWQATWSFVGAGARVGFCYALVWSEGVNIANKAAAAELATLQAKYRADYQEYQLKLAAWEKAEKDQKEKDRKEAASKPTAGNSPPPPEVVTTKGKVRKLNTPEENEFLQKWMDSHPSPPQNPWPNGAPTVKPEPGIMREGNFVQLQMDRLLLQLGVVVALGLAGLVATGFKQVRAAAEPRPDAGRIDKKTDTHDRT